jgi:hypothetical protein
VPYAMEGLVRRELQLAGAVLLEVKHESTVQFEFSAPEADCQSLIARFNEAGQGALRWLE